MKMASFHIFCPIIQFLTLEPNAVKIHIFCNGVLCLKWPFCCHFYLLWGFRSQCRNPSNERSELGDRMGSKMRESVQKKKGQNGFKKGQNWVKERQNWVKKIKAELDQIKELNTATT